LKTIIKHYPDGYDVISGVSIGAINGMFLSTFNKAQEKDAI
jgi:predicted acylesterase/phospholipase RssA